MIASQPRVSIGLPVYNGEEYLVETLEAILNQTYSHFELVISDNASTDGTQAICRAYAAKDDRIRYFRNATNVGASRNFNRTFELASGEYFKWAAADDLHEPEFLERCVTVLDQDASVILCYTLAQAIDGSGRVLLSYKAKPHIDSSKPRERFYECLCVEHPGLTIVPVLIFGVIRASVLRETPLIGNYASSDGVLLGELALRGRFHEVPEYLFLYRHHPQQSTVAYPNRHVLEGWYDPGRTNRVTFPHWRLLLEHFRSIGRAAPPWRDRMWSYFYVVSWARSKWRGLAKDLVLKASISGKPLETPLLRLGTMDEKAPGGTTDSGSAD
jgi:glycosyltransferase involved in cell wall biosynthesis